MSEQADKKPAAKQAGKKITVEQYASPIRRDARQREWLKGLGLGKIGRRREVPDNPQMRGMVIKAAHMVRIVEPQKDKA